MKHSQKRFIRRILQTLRIEKPLRALYRATLRIQLNARHSGKTIHEVYIQNEVIRFWVDDLYSRRYFLVHDNTLWEALVTQFIVEQLKDAHLFVDAGANLGYYSCLASKLMPTGQVLAFELDEMNIALLTRNLALNQTKNVHIEHAAVSDQTGTLEYLRDTDSPSLGFGLTTNPIEDQKYGEVVSVPSYALDDYFREPFSGKMVVKMDVEGAEYPVLCGMQRLLKQYDLHVFVEVHPEKIKQFNATSQDLLALLIDCGYTVYELTKLPEGETQLHLDHLKPLPRHATISKNNILYAHKSTRS